MSFEVPASIIEKYSVSGPRYTSYPTAVQFSPAVSSDNWLSELTAFYSNSQPTALYVHVPFCPSLCLFCACNKLITQRKDIIETHLLALQSEIATIGERIGSQSEIRQIHFGGGSPSYLSCDEFRRIIDSLTAAFPNIGSSTEISIEVDPRTTDYSKLEMYRTIGATRISLGVQDFDEEVQRIINRRQPYEMTKEVLDASLALGFSGTNIDLVYGLPGQTVQSFSKTVELLLNLRPSRIALYGYAHVPWIKRAQNSFDEARRPGPRERLSLFLTALNALTEAGYAHIGLDHFALPDDELAIAYSRGELKRNFMGYTTQYSDALIAFGASAISSLPNIMVQNEKEVFDYNAKIGLGRWPTERGCLRDHDDQLRGDIIHRILCEGGFVVESIEHRWGIDFWSYFGGVYTDLKGLADDGLISFDERGLKVTRLGRLLSRNVAMAFDKYLAPQVRQSSQIFSQAI